MQCKCTWHALRFRNHNPKHVWPHLLGGSLPPWEVSVSTLSSILWLQFDISNQAPLKAASNEQFFIGWILFRRLWLFLMMLRLFFFGNQACFTGTNLCCCCWCLGKGYLAWGPEFLGGSLWGWGTLGLTGLLTPHWWHMGVLCTGGAYLDSFL